MTGEKPADDEALEPDTEPTEPEAMEPEEATDANVADADADAELNAEDSVETPEPSETAGEEDLETRPPEDAPPGAPFAATRASERLSGPTRPAVVPEAKARAVASEEELPYVDDRVSRYWVIAIAAVFLLILAWGIFGGKAGLLSAPRPTEEPLPTNTPALSTAPSAPASVTPSVAPSALPSAVPSAIPSAGGPSLPPSAAPSSAPSAAAS